MEGMKMKKYIFVVFVATFVTAQVMAQSRPIMGYDQVAWGASAQTVRATYNIGDTIVLEPAADDANIMVLKQTNVSDSIQERQFMFNGDKLYRVWVFYKDTSDSTASTLKGIIENNFGRQTDYNIQTGSTAFDYVLFTTTTYIFSKYSPDLIVELIHTRAKSISATDIFALAIAENTNSLRVCYTWKKFRDEYQASKLGL
jgi:hypothetical protein